MIVPNQQDAGEAIKRRRRKLFAIMGCARRALDQSMTLLGAARITDALHALETALAKCDAILAGDLPETVEDILRAMRGRGEDGRIDAPLWRAYADRIEAAYNREVTERNQEDKL